ncbi:MAG TPA: DUF4157 domain-containing protein, partial [Kofleriaceae bacterium]|nr:DUF4157 domain-containing protein [Kofleriaceae bacterium]
MTRSMRGPELDRSVDLAPFDPVAEGTRYQLSRELSVAIWERACADATDAHGWRDLARAQQRFHDLAARIAARGGRLGLGVDKLTSAGDDRGDRYRGMSRGALEPAAPGRQTLVSAEAGLVRGAAVPAPGRQTLVTIEADRWPMADGLAGDAAAAPVPGERRVAGIAPGNPIDARSGVHAGRAARFDDFLALGWRHVLDAARARGGPGLVQATLGIADPTAAHGLPLAIAPWLLGNPSGRAMWRAAERRAATLYRRAVDAGEVEHDGVAVEAALQRCGSGQPLADGVRRALEARLGVPLGRVRIHTDGVAADAARAVNAEAFTVGEDIFFAEGAYAPESPAGQRLLVHELTHVVQAWQGRTGHDGRISQPGDALEREADAAADRTRHDPPARPTDPPAIPSAAPPIRATGSQPLLRRAAAPSGAPAQNVPAMRGGAQPTAAQTPQPQPPGASADFVDRASQTGAQAVQQLHRGIAEARANPAGEPAAADAKNHQRKSRADAHKVRAIEQHHHARANAHASHTPEAKEPAGDGHAAVDVHAPIAFKPLSDLSKYLPERGPGQDDHQRKQLEHQVKAQLESDRQDARRGLEKLRAAHLQLARDVRATKPRLLAQIASSQRDALAKVAGAESSQCAAVQRSVAAAQGQVHSHAAAAKGQVASAHAAAVAQIHDSHQAAIQHLTQKQTSALTDVQTGEALALASLAVDFLGLKTSLTDLGFKKAADAITTGNLEAAKMPARWDGDKLDAAQKAAHDTADGFATSMPQQASHQYDQVAAQRPAAERSLHDFAHAVRDNIGKAHDSANHAIEASLHSSIQAADAAQRAAIAQIDQACSSTLATLGAQRASQIAAIRQQARAARGGIVKAAAASRASVSQACDRAASGIEGGVTGLIRGARQIEAPHPEDTRRQVTKGVQDVEQGAHGAATGLSQTATRSAQGLTQQASGAAAGMASTAAAAQQSATQLAAGAGQQMGAMARGSSDGLAQTAAAHKATTDRTLHTATSTFTHQVKTLGDHYRTVAKQRQDQFHTNVTNTKASLDRTVPDHGGAGGGRGSGKQDDGGGKSGGGAAKAEVPSIQDSAKKAADAVKPWWQQALAVVVSVVVAIAVVVVVTALITTTGPFGAILVGALAGALSSMAGTIASNLVLGNSAWKGITWKSIAMGAVSGAIGAGLTEALSAGAEALAGSGSMLARGASVVKTVMNEGAAAEEGGAATELTAGQKLLKTGLDVGNDFVTNQATSLIFDHKLDLSVESLATSLATHVGTNHTKLGDLQAGAQAGIKSHLPFDIKVPKLQIEIGNPSRGGGGHGGEPASSSHASSPEPTGVPGGAPSHGAAPASHAGGDGATPARGSGDGGAAPGSGGAPGGTPARGGAEPAGAPHGSGPAAPRGGGEPTQAHGKKST